MRIVRLTALRPHFARKTVSSNRAAVLLAIDGADSVATSSIYQRKAAEARAAGFHSRADFFHDLHRLCAEWGQFDKTKIFDPDLSTPSKMDPMHIKFLPGSELRQLHLPMRRFTPPQKDEIRKQLLKMIQHKVVERAGADAWVSCVHLARKRDPVTPEHHGGGESANPVALNAIGAFMTWSDYEQIPAAAVNSLSVGSSTGYNYNRPQSLTEEVVFLSYLELQEFADACGFGGSEGLGVAMTHAISADVQIGAGSPIRWRFCIDFRRANLLMVDEFYPLPETRECILKLAGCEIFGTVDLTAMYWQCELHRDSLRNGRRGLPISAGPLRFEVCCGPCTA
jgi:hypothetical protein